MKRIITLSTLAAASILLAACGGSSNDGDDATASGDQTTTTVDIRVTPPTLPVGQVIELGSIESTIQELEQDCAEAVQPIRDLQKTYQSGLELTSADLPILNEALTAGFAACSADDWDRYQRLELQGWLNAVPSDEAIESARKELEEGQSGD